MRCGKSTFVCGSAGSEMGIPQVRPVTAGERIEVVALKRGDFCRKRRMSRLQLSLRE